MTPAPIVVAVSGASGAIYGIRLIKALVETGNNILVILSHGGIRVLAHELGYDPEQSFAHFLTSRGVMLQEASQVTVFSQDDIAGAPASGSFLHAGMVVAPCSMKTLAAVASGVADNLLTRSADVCLKEGRKLILVPRETPYNLIHLENMIRVKKAGATILPPNPSFYQFPETINDLVDTIVARILDHLDIAHTLLPRWGGTQT